MTPTTPKPHHLPGAWLTAIARVLFHKAVVEQVVHPTITDLQNEWIEAGEDHRQRRRAVLKGYVAFWSLVLMAPLVLQDWTTPNSAGEGFFQRVWRFEMTMATRIGFTALLIALGLGAGYSASYMRPVLYESTAVIQVVPPRVTNSLMDPANLPPTVSVEERVRSVSHVILSRTRLEGLIREYGLFKHERENLVMQEVVELMRRRITVRPLPVDQFVVSFADRDPKTVMTVTAKLAAFFIDESLRDSERRAQNTASFLESQAEESRRKLEALSTEVERSGRAGVSLPKRLELDVWQTRYKTLLNKQADAEALVNLERRQIGEQFTLIDPPRLPERSLGPTRLEFTLFGGAAGLAVAVLFMLIAGAWRLQRDRRLLRPITA